MTAAVLLAVVAAWHAAFQLTVTVVVYPALLGRAAPEFARAHEQHSRRVLVLVVPTYAGILAAVGWTVVEGPTGPATVVAAGAQVLVLGLTAFGAAPAHTALGREGPTAATVQRLRRVDAARTSVALVGLVAALAALA